MSSDHSHPSSGEVTRLLAAVRSGKEGASDALYELVHNDLHRQANALFAGQKVGHTLQPTALVNEAWLKLGGSNLTVSDRGHFFALAGKAMRQILTDHARARMTKKRGEGARPVTLDDQLVTPGTELDVLALDDGLQQLADLNERHARVVELRVFAGLSIDETAEALGVSHGTVETDWSMARAWLRRKLYTE
jgi:RNA polymerase sigma factor (TIGR02999 family)